MAKKLNKKTIILDLVILGVFLILGYYFVVKLVANSSYSLRQQTNNSNLNQAKTYASKTLKFTIDVPSQFQINERLTEVHLADNAKEEVIISRVGTNFSNIDDYMNDLSIKNKINREDVIKVNINGLNGIREIVKYPGGPQMGEKTYYIYSENWVYYISTNSESLFSDLDKIAQSFKYTP